MIMLTICSWDQYDYPWVIKDLIDKGAEVNEKDKHGNSALIYAVMRAKVRTIEVLLKNHAIIEDDKCIEIMNSTNVPGDLKEKLSEIVTNKLREGSNPKIEDEELNYS